MLEQETSRIIDILLQRTIGGREQIGLQEVLAATVPRGIKAYLRAEVTKWLTDELCQGRRFGTLVRGEAQSRKASTAIVSSALLEYAFPRAEFVATLDQAVHFLGNYLCRPQWTLRQFLTPGTASVSGASVGQRLAYLSDYAYLPALIGRYLESRGLASIFPAQLGSLVEQIDRLVIARGTFADLARLARPMFEFFTLASSAGAGIAVKPVLVFLSDKKQEAAQDHLEHRCRVQGISTITLADFINTLAELDESSRSEAISISPPVVPMPADKGATDGAASGSPVEDAEPSPHPATDGGATTGISDGRNVPLSLTFAGLQSPVANVEFPPLERIILDDQRRFFIDAIFDKDPAFYAGVIDALNRTPSWSEAAGYLRALFESHSIDPLSDEALEFVEAVQLRYRSGRT